jgi:hypothetical protein
VSIDVGTLSDLADRVRACVAEVAPELEVDVSGPLIHACEWDENEVRLVNGRWHRRVVRRAYDLAGVPDYSRCDVCGEWEDE